MKINTSKIQEISEIEHFVEINLIELNENYFDETEVKLEFQKIMEDKLFSLEKAKEYIDKGKYGICDKCGRNIPKERLKIIPYATKCVLCSNKTNN